MPPLDNSSQLFWAFVVFAAVMVWVFHRVTAPRREPEPRDVRQVAGRQGTNTTSTTTTSTTNITVDKINVNNPGG